MECVKCGKKVKAGAVAFIGTKYEFHLCWNCFIKNGKRI